MNLFNKYRLVKRVKTDNAGIVKTYYYIQRRFIFIWLLARVRTNHYTYQDDSNNNLKYGACITKRACKYLRVRDAQIVLAHLNTKSLTKYAGQKIERVLTDTLTYSYINRSKYFLGADFSRVYEFNSSIRELKKLIDLRIYSNNPSTP